LFHLLQWLWGVLRDGASNVPEDARRAVEFDLLSLANMRTKILFLARWRELRRAWATTYPEFLGIIIKALFGRVARYVASS
jgi:hypothetical protein